jgi:hypothetical protein
MKTFLSEVVTNDRHTRYIEHLQEVHDDLDKEIQIQYKQYGDDNLVKTLKKKKLQLKDEIECLKRTNAL